MGKHSEWRKLVKKLRRKRLRQAKAQKRDDAEAEEVLKLQHSTEYQSLLAEKLKAEKLREIEEEKLHEEREREWLRTEVQAQKQFRELQKKLALAREERARQNEIIRKEWEEEQKRREEEKKKQDEELQEKLRQEEILKNRVEEFIEDGGDTPEHLKTIYESNPNKELCPFFSKTSTCRFFDLCTRNHVRPEVSKILLIPNFFSHYSLEVTSDSSLEFENHEINQCYREFYTDVVPELEQYGTIILFVTCSNHGSHLRGNVFVEFSKTNEAFKCFRELNGRWYGGKQLSVQFVNISSWNSALCGHNFTKRCPKGSSCNFLHSFRNPKNAYSAFEKIRRDNESRLRNHTESTRSWRWSESPERPFSEENEDEWEVNGPSNRRESIRFRSSERNRKSLAREKTKRSKSRDRVRKLKSLVRNRSESKTKEQRSRSREKASKRERKERSRSKSREKVERSKSRERDEIIKSLEDNTRVNSLDKERSSSLERDRSKSRERDRSHSSKHKKRKKIT